MNLVFLGAPGAGKGTIAKIVVAKYGLQHISTGDIFRQAVKNQDTIAEEVKAIMASGRLVPDKTTINIVKNYFSKMSTNKGWILDGFPRNLLQAEALESIAKLDRVIDIDVSDKEIIKRLSGRLICKKCGKIYHKTNMPPKNQGLCDDDDGEVYTRDDDKEAAIKIRLKIYREQTKPLVKWYKKKGLLLKINGSGSPDNVFSILEKNLK